MRNTEAAHDFPVMGSSNPRPSPQAVGRCERFGDEQLAWGGTNRPDGAWKANSPTLMARSNSSTKKELQRNCCSRGEQRW